MVVEAWWRGKVSFECIEPHFWLFTKFYVMRSLNKMLEPVYTCKYITADIKNR